MKKITSKITVALLAMIIVPVILIGCGNKSKVSKEVNEGCIKFINIFDSHKKDNYSYPDKGEMDEYVKFVMEHNKKNTQEEKEILDMLGDVMTAYSTDSSEVSKGKKPILYDSKKKEFMELVNKYSK